MCSSLSVSPSFLRTLLTCISMLRSKGENFRLSTAFTSRSRGTTRPASRSNTSNRLNSTEVRSTGCAVAAHAARGRIEFNFADANNVRSGRRRLISSRAAQDRSNARDQFARVKRLRQIIVGADFQTNNAVNVFSASRQQEYWQSRSRPNPAQHLETIDPGQHYVQHDQQITTAVGALQSALAIVRALDHKPLGLQVFADQSAEFSIIVDDQNAFHLRTFHFAPRGSG